MKFHRSTRRMFLTGTGGAAVALPLLSSLVPKSLQPVVEAQNGAVPKRFISIMTYNGAPVRAFWPGTKPGFETHAADGRLVARDRLSESSGRHSDGNQYFGHEVPLSSIREGGISTIFGPNISAYSEHMLLLRGLDLLPNLNHNYGAILGNFGMQTEGVGGPLPGAQINVTIDQIMARSASVYASPPAGPRILHLGSRENTFSFEPTNTADVLSVGAGSVQRARAFTNPRLAFDATLGGLMPNDVPQGPGVSARLVDRVIDDYRRVRDGKYLSGYDRQKLEQHINRLAELETRVNQSMTAASQCSPGSAPATLDTGGEFNVDVADVQRLFENLVDIMIAAMACDVTRIGTLDVTKMVVRDGGETFGMGDSQNPNSSGRNNWHLQAHAWDANAIRWLTQGHQWIAEVVVARLLKGLSETMAPDGQSLLYHSAVLLGNELSFNHLQYGMPTALFGSAGGFLRPGRYIDYIDHNRQVRFRQHDGPVIEGVPYNRLMVTLLQAMGVQPSEYEREPGRGFGESTTIGKDQNWATDYDSSQLGAVLPGVR